MPRTGIRWTTTGPNCSIASMPSIPARDAQRAGIRKMAGFAIGMTDWESGQRRLASAVNRWRSNDAVAPVLAALGRFADGAAINDCPSLGALFRADPEPAEKVLDSFVHEAVAAMAAIPLGQLPFAMRTGGRRTHCSWRVSGRQALRLPFTTGRHCPCNRHRAARISRRWRRGCGSSLEPAPLRLWRGTRCRPALSNGRRSSCDRVT